MYEAYYVSNDKIPLYTYVQLLVSLPYLISSTYSHRLLEKSVSGFDPKSVHARFVVDNGAVEQVLLRVILFYPLGIIPTKLHTQLHQCVAVNRITNGRSRGPSKKLSFFGNGGA